MTGLEVVVDGVGLERPRAGVGVYTTQILHAMSVDRPDCRLTVFGPPGAFIHVPNSRYRPLPRARLIGRRGALIHHALRGLRSLAVVIGHARVAQDQIGFPPLLIPARNGEVLANLIAVNRKVPLTGFEVALGFAPGAASGGAAIANLRPIPIPGTDARLGIATSLPAFTYASPSPAPSRA